MKFGRRWFDGVVTDHDVSTVDELIWHVVFDDGDDCDLNLEELTAVILPAPTAVIPPHLSPTAGDSLRRSPQSPPGFALLVDFPTTIGTWVPHPRSADLPYYGRAAIASSPTTVPTPIVEGGRSINDSPPTVAYQGRDCGVSPPFSQPSNPL